MKDQLNKALDLLKGVLCGPDGKCEIQGSDEDRAVVDEALTALSELERMAGEPVAWMYDWLPAGGPTAYDWISSDKAEVFAPENCYFNIRPLYATTPAQQPQYEAGDMASAHNDGFRAGVANVAQQQAEAAPNPAVAAIEYAITHSSESPIEFLNCWMHGDFDVLRKDWENVPDAVFVGANPSIKVPQQPPLPEASPATKGQCNDERACGACWSGQGACEVAQQPQAYLLAAAKEFCRKVEAGEARSTKSYAAFKAAIEQIEKQPQVEAVL